MVRKILIFNTKFKREDEGNEEKNYTNYTGINKRR